MAFSNYDASTTNQSKRSNRIYSDLNLSFTKNPATKDVAKLFDVQAIKRAVKNIILTNKYERPFNSCLLYTSPSPRDRTRSRMPSSA